MTFARTSALFPEAVTQCHHNFAPPYTCKRICRRRLKRLKPSFDLTYVRLREFEKEKPRSRFFVDDLSQTSQMKVYRNQFKLRYVSVFNACCCLHSRNFFAKAPALYPVSKAKLWKNKLFTEDYQGRERFLSSS